MNTIVDNLTIGEGITNIPNMAFSGFALIDELDTSISELSLPNSLESIGTYAFSYVKNLTSVKLPDNLKYIESNAFQNSGVQNVTMSKSLKTIGNAAFYYNDIKSVEFYEGLTSIGDSAFNYNKNLINVIIPSSISEIGASAFGQASGTITMLGRTDLNGINVGDYWNGDATIVYE